MVLPGSLLAIVGIVGIFITLITGVRALIASYKVSGDHAHLLRYIALNQIEPSINIFLVSALLWIGSSLNLPTLIMAFLATTPMLVLFWPLRGRTMANPDHQRLAKHVAHLGIWRWALNTACFAWIGLNTYLELNETLLVLVAMGVIAASIIQLYRSAMWASEQLDGALAPPVQPVVPPPSVVAARPATNVTLAPPLPAIPVQLNYQNASPCPHCRVLVALTAAECQSCGLVLNSRTPLSMRNLPRYDVLRPLNEGGMSRIYLAQDRAGQHWCVVKSVATLETGDLSWQSEAIDCLTREAEILRTIHHEGIVEFLGWYPNDGPFLALGYVPGPALDIAIDQRQASMLSTLRIGADVADALCVLLQRPTPIVHGDIKPGNIIINSETGRAILVDFGSASLLGAATSQYGTPGYAAPEQYRGVSTPTTDVYGLATTLYHALTGDDPTAHPLQFPQIDQLPLAVAYLLKAALAQDPTQRPDACRFREGLCRLLSDPGLSEQHDPMLLAAVGV
ncbi:MAG: hypothetical protein Fur005_03080 [Roseiflexaceae bacterium]